MLPVSLASVRGAKQRLLAASAAFFCLGLDPGQAGHAGVLRDAPTTERGALVVRVVSPMARCMATWDRSSQMSKREWKETCKRVVKNNPRLYNKAF